MLSRVRMRAGGLAYYLLYGKRNDSEYLRNDKDNVVPLYGSLDILKSAEEYCIKNKPKWKNNYEHITISFSDEDIAILDEFTEKEQNDIYMDIALEMIKHRTSGYCLENEVIAYAELHDPKIKKEVDRKTGEIKKRKKHIHVGISYLNPLNNTKLRTAFFNNSYISDTIDKYIAKKHGLTYVKVGEPSDADADKPVSKTALIRKELIGKLAHIKNADQLKEYLDKKGIDWKIAKGKNGNYYKLINPDGKNINLRGKDFSHLGIITNQNLTDEDKHSHLKDLEKKTLEQLGDVLEYYYRTERIPVIGGRRSKETSKKLNDIYSDIGNDIESDKINSFTSLQEKIFYKHYKHLVTSNLKGYYVDTSKNENIVFTNKAKDIRVVDKGDVITANSSTKALPEKVQLMLDIAQAKSWNISSLVVTGSDEFKAEARRQIDALHKDKNMELGATLPKQIRFKKGLENGKAKYTEQQRRVANLPEPSDRETNRGSKTKTVHDLRKLSQCGVVHDRSDLKVLLQNNDDAKLGEEGKPYLAMRCTRVSDVKATRERIKNFTFSAVRKNKKTLPVPSVATRKGLKDPRTIGEYLSREIKSKIEIEKKPLSELKQMLKAENVLAHAVKKYDLDADQYEVTEDNKINNLKNRQKPKNVIDFLQREISLTSKEAIEECQALYRDQPLEVEVHQEKELENMPLKLSISKDTKIVTDANGKEGQRALDKWETIEVSNYTDLLHLMLTYPYSRASFADGYRKGDNVRGYGNLLIYDIDNDKYDEPLSKAEVETLLEKHGLSAMMVGSRSDGKRKKVSSKHQKQHGKPVVEEYHTAERYRIVIPTETGISDETDRESYIEFQELTARALGLSKYTDPSALADRARFYYPSPKPDYFTTKGRVMDISKLEQKAKKMVQQRKEEEAKKKAKLEEIRTNIQRYRHVEAPNIKNLTFTDAEQIIAIDIVSLMRKYENILEDKKEGSYHYIKTSNAKYSIVKDKADSTTIAHDFKNDESYNSLQYLQMEFQTNNLNTISRELEKSTGLDFIEVNIEAVKTAVATALETATGDKTFEESIKGYFGCTYCKLDKDCIKIADQEIKLSDIDMDKKQVIDSLKVNREEFKQQLEAVKKAEELKTMEAKEKELQEGRQKELEVKEESSKKEDIKSTLDKKKESKQGQSQGRAGGMGM